MSRRTPHRPAAGSSAATLERLAVLLESGVAPAAAWAYLAAGATKQESGPASVRSPENGVLESVAQALARGEPGAFALSRALDSDEGRSVRQEEWRQTAAAWEVSETSGSPLGACLRSSAEAARALTQARREADVALSGPVATSKIVLALPVFGLLMGALLGFDTVGVLFGRPLGWGCLIAATALVAVARAWNARLVGRAVPPPGVPGLDLELLAVAVSAGGSWPDARRLVERALDRHCRAITLPTPNGDVESLVSLSERAGVPGAALLRSGAAERRREARAAAAIAAERLGVLLMLPLGLCILPAFVLVGVVPLFLALLSSTGLSS